MLARAIVVCAFVVALASALLHASALLARASLHRAASAAVSRSFDAALAAEQAGIAAAIAAGGDPRDPIVSTPAIAPACADVAPDGTCVMIVTVALTPTTTRRVSDAAVPGDCTPRCAMGLQANDAVEEGRFSARITASAAGARGAVFALRDRYAIFRTTRTAPYASLIGTRDATAQGVALGTSEGEDAGAPALTTVDVRYVNATTGAAFDGNAWRSRPWADADAGATAWEP